MLWLWAVAFFTGFAVVYGLDINIGHETYSTAENIAYGGLYRAAWGLALGWVIFACSRGYGGWINDFLSWGAFVPLSRLSYIIYLTHLTVIQFLETLQDFYIPGTNTMMVRFYFITVVGRFISQESLRFRPFGSYQS